ncbi:gamma-glutamyltransferase family protein [Aminobacter aminovorans]|uniref:Gamma-glutamyltransferase n=1 Tax=Aminobacter aminovorans TaxID=83263 RepID=A0AAC8YJ30_AMIAI|nr:gamma-glutamyltransferase [Aminobacter aminovorans]AMS39275.1 gamma-glutamyltransferase [Aminobacter aminovorans]MBB3709179.1 gamma-glutamyltranspeptidase/glutathione hydrolase [Aminobacter aminovorans]WMC97446.1 gamma-glutamyltransferase [Aminobacter aminovorans]
MDSSETHGNASVRSETAMVATGHPLAARAAQDMLAAGGTAVDAAIAADAILGVVEPMATGIGGDLLAMLVEPDGHAISYNGTGRSPAALSIEALEKLPNRRIPERHGLSVTVPGAVRGWFDLHGRFGRLPFAQLIAPAIALAADGFAVLPITGREWAVFEPVIKLDPVAAKLYSAGSTPREGERFANPELAAMLRAIAADGPDAFYLGTPARQAAAANQTRGGLLTAEDFANHRGDFVLPLERKFRGLTVLECPPNTHGMAVLDALEELDALPLDRDDPTTTRAMVEAVGRAMAKAKKIVADPSGNTVCTVVVDKDGLAVTLMSSIFKRFGSGIAVPGCGFVLQNRGLGFSEPGHINGPGPSKRPYHTVIPAATLKDGRFHAGFGVVGGAMQPQGHVQMMVRLAAWGEKLQPAIDAPRWRLEGDMALAIEPGTPDAIVRTLRDAGYSDPEGAGELAGRSDFGGAQFVVRDEDGSLLGGSDKRKDGVALGA